MWHSDEPSIKELMGEPNDGEDITKGEYMLAHPRCAVCHWPAHRKGRWLELHHIVSGPGRKDLPGGRSWLSLCCRCHHALHHQRLHDHSDLTRGAILAAKEEEDGPVDTAELASLKGRKALPYDQCPIPIEFLADRLIDGGDPWP